MPTALIPPDDWALCNPDKPYCGEPFFEGSTGGEKESDKLVCPIGGNPRCAGDCECLLCYFFRVKGEDKIYIRLPEPSLPKGTITRKMAASIKKKVKDAGAELGVKIEFDWVCVCLQEAPVTVPKKKK